MPSASILIRLVDLPIALCEAAAEQWDGMIREYALRGMSGVVQPYGLDEVSRAGNALAALAAAVADVSVATTGPSSWLRGAERREVELHYERPGDFAVLQGVLDDVNHLIRAGDVLVLPPLPEVIALRDWLCEEVAEQNAGAPPTGWRLESGADDPADTAPVEWTDLLAPPPHEAWVVADDRNRIVHVSQPALDLLGWVGPELIGQRLLVLIPEHLREAHVAGYTRSVVSGGAGLLGQPLRLPALMRSGRQIDVVLTLTRHAARRGRQVYLGRLAVEPPT